MIYLERCCYIIALLFLILATYMLFQGKQRKESSKARKKMSEICRHTQLIKKERD